MKQKGRTYIIVKSYITENNNIIDQSHTIERNNIIDKLQITEGKTKI
jgi:hypothetical protein